MGPAIEKSLSDFGLDYLDMYMVHWPVALKPSAVFPGSGADFASTAQAPLQDTWGAMESVHAEGLTRHVGVSNFSAKKLEGLLPHAKVKPEVNRIELHPFLQSTAPRRAFTSPPTRRSARAIVRTSSLPRGPRSGLPLHRRRVLSNP